MSYKDQWATVLFVKLSQTKQDGKLLLATLKKALPLYEFGNSVVHTEQVKTAIEEFSREMLSSGEQEVVFSYLISSGPWKGSSSETVINDGSGMNNSGVSYITAIKVNVRSRDRSIISAEDARVAQSTLSDIESGFVKRFKLYGEKIPQDTGIPKTQTLPFDWEPWVWGAAAASVGVIAYKLATRNQLSQSTATALSGMKRH
jgi:hypothetical protein